jgi:hypothetical protein
MADLGLFDSLFPELSKKCKEMNSKWPEGFHESFTGKCFQISDRMIMEHEDMNTTIYYSILGSVFMLDLFNTHPRERGVEREIKSRMTMVAKDLGLTRNESERISHIYNAQRNFYQEQSENKTWVKNFKNKSFFQEAFILYKIVVRAKEDDQGIQRALFWEIGMRKKLQFAIRKVVTKSLGENTDNRGHSRQTGSGRKKFFRRPKNN